MIRIGFWVAMLAVALALASGCGGDARERAVVKDPALDARLERLLVVILDSASSDSTRADSLSLEASRLIEELGGRDSTAKLLAARLLQNSDRWIPLLDSLARVSSPPPRPPSG